MKTPVLEQMRQFWRGTRENLEELPRYRDLARWAEAHESIRVSPGCAAHLRITKFVGGDFRLAEVNADAQRQIPVLRQRRFTNPERCCKALLCVGEEP
jgi:hypothetical protein